MKRKSPCWIVECKRLVSILSQSQKLLTSGFPHRNPAHQRSRLSCNTIWIVTISDTQGWGVSPRGAGYLFGSDVVAQVSFVLVFNH